MMLQRLLAGLAILCVPVLSECNAQSYTPPIPGPPRIIAPVVMKISFDALFKVNGSKISSPWDIAIFRKRYYKPQNVVISDDNGVNITAWKGKDLDVLRIVNGYQILGLTKSKG
jgi:hypothetical protein